MDGLLCETCIAEGGSPAASGESAAGCMSCGRRVDLLSLQAAKVCTSCLAEMQSLIESPRVVSSNAPTEALRESLAYLWSRLGRLRTWRQSRGPHVEDDQMKVLVGLPKALSAIESVMAQNVGLDQNQREHVASAMLQLLRAVELLLPDPPAEEPEKKSRS